MLENSPAVVVSLSAEADKASSAKGGHHGHRRMQKAATKHRGAQTELLACAFLLGEGYEVFRNISAHGTADIIACRGGGLLRIDGRRGRRASANLSRPAAR